MIDKLFQAFFKQKRQTFAGSSFLNIRICCFLGVFLVIYDG